ncbi:MAG: phosphatidylglycerophosphatase A, partial [Deltaproteobacteria bacterium]|nr:phosphatidylglycerophosphatase A [Deltaproteobacteria bacterium]
TALCLSTWFGVGALPGAPGTYGTIGAIPLAIWMMHTGVLFDFLLMIFIILVGLWSSGRSQKMVGQDDPQEVVIDEVAGYVLTVFLHPPSWIALGAGFVFFRFFDICKPFPVRHLEKMPGGLGIVADDLMAGIYANLCLWVMRYVM